MSSPLRPALFLDRDGIINLDTNYLYKIEDVVFVDGIVELIRAARAKNYAIIVVTNQSGIGRGYYSEDDFHVLMDWMGKELASQGAALDGVYYSPFHPVHGVGPYQADTDCRKPGPGMLLRAANEHGLDLTQSIMVGDRCTDIGAASAAGVPKRYLLTGTDNECKGGPPYEAINALEEVLSAL